MARPPAISMHRARGASVPSRRRRIRRPGRARRAAVQRQDPRCPRVRRSAPIVPWARTTGPPPACPQSAVRPTAGRCKFGPAALVRRPRDARELGESRGRASSDLRGRAWAPLARRAFVFVRDKGPSRRWSRTRRPGPAGHSSARSGDSIQGSRSREKRSGAVRDGK